MSEIPFPVQTQVTLDSNWRWLHIKGDYVNCYDGNLWDDEFCPDARTCTSNCELGEKMSIQFNLRRKGTKHLLISSHQNGIIVSDKT